MLISKMESSICDPYDLTAGGRYMTQGTFTARSVVPSSNASNPSNPATFWFDPANHRYKWQTNANTFQLTLSNGTYFWFSDSPCLFSPLTQMDEVAAWQAAAVMHEGLFPIDGAKLYTGFIRDVAAGPQYVSVTILQVFGRMRSLGFGQVFNGAYAYPGVIFPVHVNGIFHFTSTSTDFSASVFDVPTECLNTSHLYNDFFYPNGTLVTPI